MKPRHHLYLDDELTDELERLAAKPGASKSAIVSDALRQYLHNRGGNAQDQAVLKRLDRISQQCGQNRKDLEMLQEALTQFVHVYLLLTANVASPDETARKVAQIRFDNYIDRVGQGG
ncbi:CopG family transcriptional regulator [Asticcacaulis sp. ZE23SCel15]|uniref:ribbon-helix-helix domain-containing protein n=1 Tax=Asticcacaulis sp. ZE23SCel15 TaxID=3059027 RepID=UPI00265E2446|nr:CopG family transcriptional regulator [Asticcacaulis sp. ZE23SCel15]WKL58004.1 CopG family transcriptional regulator [Asticcacaulis sp. ZE23SCel15]